ncbi:MAG: carbohydrate ABC transporter permease, partial [Clostridia bacterium]|nr:carbohydrate ABC transporter permease [Clostridia bacterium]
MVEKTTKSRIAFCALNYGLLVVFGFICLIPLWHVLMASVSEPRLLMASSGILFAPLGKATLEGYGIVLSNSAVIEGYGNTLLYVAVNAIVGTFLTAIAGFLVSRKNFRLAKPLTAFIMFTMIFNGGLIPSYMVIRGLGLINTRWAIILPALMNAYFIIVMKSSFEQLPAAYEESAKLDGAGPVRILFQILLPLVKPTLVVVIMFAIIGQWNSWYPASIYLPRVREKWPLQLIMRSLLIQNDVSKLLTSSNDANHVINMTGNLVKYCVTIVGTLPILVAYP